MPIKIMLDNNLCMEVTHYHGLIIHPRELLLILENLRKWFGENTGKP